MCRSSVAAVLTLLFATAPSRAIGAQTPAADLPRLTRVAGIGCLDCDDAHMFSPGAAIGLDAAGNVYVGDVVAPTIRVFSPSAKLLRSWGVAGDGPGETRRPARIFVDRRRDVIVVDRNLHRITWFDSVGRILSSQPLPASPVSSAVSPGDGALYALMSVPGPGGSSNVARFDDRGRPIASPVPVVDTSTADPFERPLASIVVRRDGAFLGANGLRTYRILPFEHLGGPALHRIERDLPQPRMSDAEYDAFAGRMREVMAKVAARTGRPVPDVSPPRDKPQILDDGLRIDDHDRLWVLTGRGDEQRAVLDVFSERGDYEGQVVLPQPVLRFAIAGSWLATFGEDADGVPVVTLWRIRNP